MLPAVKVLELFDDAIALPAFQMKPVVADAVVRDGWTATVDGRVMAGSAVRLARGGRNVAHPIQTLVFGCTLQADLPPATKIKLQAPKSRG